MKPKFPYQLVRQVEHEKMSNSTITYPDFSRLTTCSNLCSFDTRIVKLFGSLVCYLFQNKDAASDLVSRIYIDKNIGQKSQTIDKANTSCRANAVHCKIFPDPSLTNAVQHFQRGENTERARS